MPFKLLLSVGTGSLAACKGGLTQQICKRSALPLLLDAGVSTAGQAACLLFPHERHSGSSLPHCLKGQSRDRRRTALLQLS